MRSRSVELGREDSENLDDATVTRRLRAGIVMLTGALACAAVFERWGVSSSTRLWLFIPFFFAMNAFFQAVFKNCGISAFQGMRHTVCGEERVACRQARDAVLARGKKQLTLSFLAAALLTSLFAMIG